MQSYRARLEFEVRDYECDLSGIVNHANYLHYLEHARHVFLKAQGIDFAQWASQGTHLVIIRIEVDYLSPLRSGERFWVGSNTRRVSPLRFGIDQDIYCLADDRPILRARLVGSAINEHGRPALPKELKALLDAAIG